MRFCRAVEADPRNMRFREGVAREELALGLSDAASATLLAVLELHGKEAHLWDLLGTAYTVDGHYLEEIAAHRRALV